MCHYAVGITFDNNGYACRGNPVAGVVESVEGIAFVKQGCSRRIYVFSGGVIEGPATEADYSARYIGNRKHQAIYKFIGETGA